MINNKRWIVPPLITPEVDTALSAFPPILRQILFNRGYTTDAEARAYLNAKPDFNTDPFQMSGMKKSVDRIQTAIQKHEPIAIYGDYDVDGVTSTALLVETLQQLNANVRGYIPNRFEEGYGLNNNALDELKADGVQLVITVDCGIRSPSEALHAQTIGLDLIISDHHHPAEGDLPPHLP
ncbi:MAG: DHH family phosphoesterase [Anaerolineales bacterium]|nr:DHH family phosphoesterase [Anaerolineales bacterium]